MSLLNERFHIVDAQAGFEAASEAAYKVIQSLHYMNNYSMTQEIT